MPNNGYLKKKKKEEEEEGNGFPRFLVYGLRSHNSSRRLAEQEMTSEHLKSEEKATAWVSKHCILTEVVAQASS